MNRFEFVEAPGFDDAARWTKDPSTVARAGGIDVMDLMKEHLLEPDRVVSLRRIAGGAGVKEEDGNLVIGSLTTLAALAADPLVRARARAVAVAAGEAASPQIRNQATVAGNLLQRPRCWYFRREELVCARKGGPECLAHDGENRFHAIFGNDRCAIVHPSNLAPALMVHDAFVRTVKPDGSKREIEVAKLFLTPEMAIYKEHCLEPGEMVVDLVVPKRAGGDRSTYAVLREKQSFDWPLVAASARVVLDGAVVREARIVLGSVCPVPLRREEAEAFLSGKPLDETTAREAGRLAVKGATPLAQNGYKVALASVLTARALLAAAKA